MVILPVDDKALMMQGLGRAGLLWCGSGYESIGEITAP